MPLAAIFPDSYEPVAWLWAGFGAAAADRRRALGRPARSGSWPIVGAGCLLLAAAFAFPPVVGELVLGNVHLELLALFALAWWGIRQRRRARPGGGRAGHRGGRARSSSCRCWSSSGSWPRGRWRAAVWSVVGAAGAHRPDAADHRTRAVARVPDRARQHGAGRRTRPMPWRRPSGWARSSGRCRRGSSSCVAAVAPSCGAPGGRSSRPATASRSPPRRSSRRPSSTTTWRCWCCPCCWRWRPPRRPAGSPSPTSACGAASSPPSAG